MDLVISGHFTTYLVGLRVFSPLVPDQAHSNARPAQSRGLCMPWVRGKQGLIFEEDTGLRTHMEPWQALP